jgi:hypothetical protein
MNLNLIRTLLSSIAGVLVIVMAYAPKLLGCTIDAVTGGYDCTASWLPPAWVATVASVLMVLNLILKAVQGGGFGTGLVAPTVVVSPSGEPGTVTKAQVESGPKK